MSGLTQSTIAFIQGHAGWGAPIVFALAFCESFAFVSLIVPATGILFGIGGLMGATRPRAYERDMKNSPSPSPVQATTRALRTSASPTPAAAPR